MVARVQEARIGTNNTPPADGSLLPGQFYLEMGTPTRLWVGVPTSIVVSGVKLLMDVDAQTALNASYVPKAGATMTGPLVLSGEPAAALGAATKQTVDLKAPIASPAFTGTPSLPTGTVAITQTPGNNTTAPATTAFVTAAVAPALTNVGRNLIHNPLFNVQQRGAGPFAANGLFTLDRWLMQIAAGNTASISPVALSDANRASIGDEAAQWSFYNTFAGAAGAGDFIVVGQATESVRRLAGKTVTVSFWATAGSGTPRIGASIDQTFGTGGSPSADANGTGQSVIISTTPTRYSMTFTIPSASGKTLGTAGNDATKLMLWYSAGSTMQTRAGGVPVQSGAIWLWGMQLEIGSVMTPLEKPDPQQDLAKCQRFFSNQSFFLSAQGAAGTTFGGSVTLPMQMRAAPTVVFTGSTTPTNATAQSIGQVNNAGCIVYATASSTAFTQINTTLSASADL